MRRHPQKNALLYRYRCEVTKISNLESFQLGIFCLIQIHKNPWAAYQLGCPSFRYSIRQPMAPKQPWNKCKIVRNAAYQHQNVFLMVAMEQREEQYKVLCINVCTSTSTHTLPLPHVPRKALSMHHMTSSPWHMQGVSWIWCLLAESSPQTLLVLFSETQQTVKENSSSPLQTIT